MGFVIKVTFFISSVFLIILLFNDKFFNISLLVIITGLIYGFVDRYKVESLAKGLKYIYLALVGFLSSEKQITFVVLTLFIISLPLISFELDYSDAGFSVYHDEWRGYQVFLWGWLGFIQKTVGWYANPLLFLGLIYIFRESKKSIIFSGSGLMIALSSLTLDKFWIDEHIIPHVSKWGAGFYIWLLCFIVLLVGSIVIHTKNRKIQETEYRQTLLPLLCNTGKLSNIFRLSIYSNQAKQR